MTTIVQQIDAQGPVVVERITTHFEAVACSSENARKLVEALHNGTAVTLTADGKTATFTPMVNLGYGEVYMTLALAAEALRNAGVTGCANPEQWQAVLLGGPLVAAGTTTTTTTRSASASSSSHFPGILALRSQGQGWGQIAQTTNVQLGQVVSSARTSLNMDDTRDTLSPTGRSSAEMERSRSTPTPGATDPTGRDQGTGRDKFKDPRHPGSYPSRDDTETTSPRSTPTTPSTTPPDSSSTTPPRSSTTPPSSATRPD